MSYVSLSDADIRKADFTKTVLDSAEMKNANICEADFTNAKMNNVSLEGANAKEADFTEAVLCRADLRGVDFTGAILNYTKFKGALNLASAFLDNLRGAVLEGVNLKGVSLKGVDLTGTKFKGSLNLASARLDNLRGAVLEGVNLSGISLKGVDLNGVNLKGADLNGAYLKGADLTGVDLTGCNVDGAVNFHLACGLLSGGREPVIVNDGRSLVYGQCEFRCLPDSDNPTVQGNVTHALRQNFVVPPGWAVFVRRCDDRAPSAEWRAVLEKVIKPYKWSTYGLCVGSNSDEECPTGDLHTYGTAEGSPGHAYGSMSQQTKANGSREYVIVKKSGGGNFRLLIFRLHT